MLRTKTKSGRHRLKKTKKHPVEVLETVCCNFVWWRSHQLEEYHWLMGPTMSCPIGPRIYHIWEHENCKPKSPISASILRKQLHNVDLRWNWEMMFLSVFQGCFFRFHLELSCIYGSKSTPSSLIWTRAKIEWSLFIFVAE